MSSNDKKNKINKKYVLSIILIILLTLAIILGIGLYYLNNLLNKIEKVEIKESDLGIVPQVQAKLSNFSDIKNVVLFGIDSEEGKSGRSDSIMIATIDTKHKKLKLTSVMRDSYVHIDGHGKDKLNHAYAFGGPKLAIKTLNETFHLNIKDFASVNFSTLPKIINTIGGVDIDIQENEINFINHMVLNLNHLYNTKSPQIQTAGLQTIDGTQAMAYCRIRYTVGGDYRRAERHRIVLTKVFEKIKKLPTIKYPNLLNELLPMIKTSLDSKEILSIANDIFSFDNIVIEQARFPKDKDSKGELIKGVYYLIFDKESTINDMHKWLFEDK
ncbi:LCP family protein [Clostridium tarantellae]|uniref:LytR family transcriptional regulator n=1 Tax=Clostridium tarantellae TaxID=39493 RepID=A0A6I1MNZ7_9CLOT|nr:LCP family protein [Clostridium tarantellae]MPQ45226.1 LytR family transcriptional regulator [Clostridium tarantellae]